MFPIVHIFGLALQLPPLTVLIGALLALSLAERAAKSAGISADTVNNAGVIAMIAGVLGARLGYVWVNWSAYVDHPAAALSLSATGFLTASGWLCAGLAGLIYLRWRRALGLQTLDALAPALTLFLAVWALSALFSGDGNGTPTQLPWAVDLWGARRHPVQAYEAILLLLLTVALWLAVTHQTQRPPGALLWLAVAGNAAIRVFVDGFRESTLVSIGPWMDPVRASQLASVLICVVALSLAQASARFSRPRSVRPHN